MPYKGSKNSIAEWIVDVLPAGSVLVDLFGGGGAVTHCALHSHKWEKIIYNDTRPGLTQLFVDSINGKYTLENHKEWITREQFNAEKDINPYISIVWSFGNNGKDYLYGKDVERDKEALHYAVMFSDLSKFHALGIYPPKFESVEEPWRRYSLYRQTLNAWYSGKQYAAEGVDRLQNLERLQSLQNLERLQSSYERVDVPPGSIVYCDIPYNNTNCGSYGGFNHDQFYEWARKRDDVFISEFSMPEDFVVFAEVERWQHMAAADNSQTVTEKIFTTPATLKALAEREPVPGEQLTLF